MPACYPRWASKRFLRGGFHQGRCQLVAQTQGYQLVCIWGSLVEFREGGVLLKNLFCAGLWILLKFPPRLIPVFQSSASPSNWGGLVSSWMSAYCTDYQGYQLVCIWGSLVKFQGGGVVLNFDALPHLDAVCMQAMLLLIFQVNKQLTWRL